MSLVQFLMPRSSFFLSEFKQGLFRSNCKNSEDLDSIFRLHNEGTFGWRGDTQNPLWALCLRTLIPLFFNGVLCWPGIPEHPKRSRRELARAPERCLYAQLTPHRALSPEVLTGEFQKCSLALESWSGKAKLVLRIRSCETRCLANVTCLRLQFGAGAFPVVSSPGSPERRSPVLEA